MNGSVEAKGLLVGNESERAETVKDLVGGFKVVGGVLMVGCGGGARGVVRGVLR